VAESENPTRRYKWFRPRQAARATYYNPGFTNFFATVDLYNNSTGPYYLVVRALRISSFSGALQGTLYYARGQTTGSYKNGVPLVPSSATPPGLVGQAAIAAIPANQDFAFEQAASVDNFWNHDFPLAVLEPGGALVCSNKVVTVDLQVAFIWEYITADELDFIW
jgi:hypothetical protein